MHSVESIKARTRLTDAGCWEWLGAGGSYGIISVKRNGKWTTEGAHRVMYRLAHGEIPKDWHICHKCDFPRCVNPEHLFAGRARDNVLDAVKKGRWHSRWGAADARV